MAGNSIISSLFWKAGERLTVQGIGLFVQIILARILLPEDFSCLAIINAILNYLGLFVQCGLSIAVVQKKDLTDRDLATLTSISLIVALVLFAILFFMAPSISDFYSVGDLVWPIRVMGLSLFLYSFNSIQTGLLTRKMQFRTLFYRGLLATSISGLLGIVLAYSGFGIWALIAYSITGILLAVIFMNMIPELRLSIGFSWKSAKELYSFSLKILGTNLISAGGDTIRTLTIGKAYSPNQLAFFDRGLAYSNLVTQVVNASLSSVLLPTFSRSQDDIKYLREMSQRSVELSSYIMIPLLVFVAIVAEPLVGIVLSEKWIPCAIYLSIFCILRIPGIITSIDKQVFYAMGKSQIGLYFEIGLLMANLISLCIMLPYGPFAIAIGFTIIEYIGNTILCIIASKVYGYTIVDRLRGVLHPVINSLVLFIACYSVFFLHLNYYYTLSIQLVVGAVCYYLMSIITHDKNFIYIKKSIINAIRHRQ